MSLGQYDNYAGYYNQLIIEQTPPDPAFMREFYKILYAYYATNGLYDFLNNQLQATKVSGQSLKPIRNPAWRVVEFYASKLFPGKLPEALPIEADNQAIIQPIQQVWIWSNFSSLKQRLARWFSIYGDLFIKATTKGEPVTAVYLTLIKPENVTEMELDERGFLNYIKIDVPEYDEEQELTVHTEEWNKETQVMSVWVHKLGLDKKVEELGTPTLSRTFQETHGENYIPIVYQPFRDDGSGRANGAYSAQLDKIDEANRQATRLAQILFRYNRAIWAATNSGLDSSGRPLPPVSFDGLLEDTILNVGDDDILSLPGSADLKPLVPPINFGAALDVLESQMKELEKDLPELQYYELRSMGEVSGRAVKLLLDDVISRVVEVRGNAETALERSNAMALDIGARFKLFSGVGEYSNGDFAHNFLERPILPEDSFQQGQLIQLLVAAGASIKEAAIHAGLTEEAATRLGQIDLFEQEIGGR